MELEQQPCYLTSAKYYCALLLTGKMGRVDEYIRAQEQQQSPRSPVTACATHEEEGSYEMELLELPQAIDEELDEDEVPAASSPEASEAVAVCLFDPEVVSEQRLQELCDEEATARQQVEQQFRHELQELQELQDRRGGARAEEAEVEAETKVRYQDGSSVLVFDMGAEITEEVGFVDVFVELIGLG
ncbi:Hypothetical protein SCF082_LOCUS12946 [Durusdinium trenchii]|uniref:Uncharacterized protein n=1 Tax=Durusdinium trenchii TaxID=1381693 RepID=A0ABP0JN71_9DINO